MAARSIFRINNCVCRWWIQRRGRPAQQGGQILLPLLAQLNANGPYYDETGIAIESEGPGSQVELSSQANFTGGAVGAVTHGHWWGHDHRYQSDRIDSVGEYRDCRERAERPE